MKSILPVPIYEEDKELAYQRVLAYIEQQLLQSISGFHTSGELVYKLTNLIDYIREHKIGVKSC
jgi:hypothetical protein